MITVCAGVAFKNNKILITRRKKTDSYSGMWEFPGGKLEKNETPEECIIREIEEELCVESEVVSFIREIIHSYPDKTIRLLFYEIKLLNFNICLNEHDKALWEDINNLSGYDFLEADIPFIEFLKKEYL